MSPHRVPRAGRVLVVDDSPDNLFLIQATLEGEGYDIYLAEDGKTALAKVDELLPDLILLDVMMPEMDGYEVTERIRQNDTLPYIPILLITAHERSSVVKGLDMGADDFIRKPVDVEELLARVRSLLRLKHSIDEREQMIRQREDFVSRLTHDLRTPLVAADRILKLLQDEAFGSITPDIRQVLGDMIRNNKNLLQMVNMILEVYRHDAGHKNWHFLPCDLNEVVNDVVRDLTPMALERGLSLMIDMGADSTQNGTTAESMVVMGDRLELHRMFVNLIENAIKFTEQGSVKVRLNPPLSPSTPNGLHPSTAASQEWVVIEIEDSGTGIPREDQRTLFDRFRQSDQRRSNSGLGLYLSRRIAESHRGTIECKSEIGHGSVFTIRLPAKAQE